MKEETPYERAVRINANNIELNEKIRLSFEERMGEPSFLLDNVQGYVHVNGGPHGLSFQKPFFALCKVHDEGKPWMRDTHLVLTKTVGGLAWIRYRNPDIFAGCGAIAYARKRLSSHLNPVV